jgi:peptidoglycan/LPS O-acetylase OafA/YrhL
MVLIALIAAITAICYFAFALYLLLLPLVVPPAAALLTGILILVTALALIAIARAATRPRHRRRHEPSPAMEAAEDAAGLGTEIGRKVRGLADAHGSGGLLAALVAGFAVGVSPKLRAFLQSILKP